MKKFIFPLLSLFFVLGACASSKVSGDTPEASTESADPVEQEVLFKNVAEGDSLFASIKRGHCFGKCPVYEMNIYNNGHVTLNGIAHVDLIGKYTRTIRQEDMLKFVDKAKLIGFMDLEDEYDNPYLMDVPAATTSIVIDGKRKTVRRRVDFPTSILAFEKLFDNLLNREGWIQERGG